MHDSCDSDRNKNFDNFIRTALYCYAYKTLVTCHQLLVLVLLCDIMRAAEKAALKISLCGLRRGYEKFNLLTNIDLKKFVYPPSPKQLHANYCNMICFRWQCQSWTSHSRPSPELCRIPDLSWCRCRPGRHMWGVSNTLCGLLWGYQATQTAARQEC